MIFVREDLQQLFPEQDIASFAAIDGEIYKKMPGRHTLRFERGGRGFFIKVHFGVGWREIIKNLFMLRLPVTSARNEWQAIKAFKTLHIDTMKLAAYGIQGLNPARRKSFVMTEALENTESLDKWLPILMQHPDRHYRFRMKRAILLRLAEISRKLHGNGLNHRDFYLCHFRIDLNAEPRPETFRIYLMDLHRVQQRHHTPLRWIAKDISALLYSALYDCAGLQLNSRDLIRFTEAYRACSWRQSRQLDTVLWHKVVQRTVRMYRKDHGRAPQLPWVLEF